MALLEKHNSGNSVPRERRRRMPGRRRCLLSALGLWPPAH